MTSDKAKNIVAVGMLFTVVAGAVNSIGLHGKMPSARFLIGSGIVWFVLSGVADIEPEIAVPLAVAVLTTSLLTNDSGILDWLNKRGEMTPASPANVAKSNQVEPPGHPGILNRPAGSRENAPNSVHKTVLLHGGV